MASIKKDYNSMGLPMNINRSNPIPVDCTELWYSLEEAQNYAQNDPRAYVGQSIKVVENNTVTAYIIEDTAGNLMQLADTDSVGSGGDGSGVIVDSAMSSTSTNPVQNKVIYDALSNKADKEHTHDNLQLYDTVTGVESIEINAAMLQCPIEVTLSSEVYTDLSQITVVLNSDSGTQNAVSSADGIVTGLSSESTFTLSLQSDMDNFDPSQVTISCTYQLDLNQVLHDYVLHVDLDGEENPDDADDIIIIDTTLSLSGAAADAKAVGDKLIEKVDKSTFDKLVGDTSVAEQIANAVANKIDTPESVTVGQVLSVKSIDENGTVTWETVDQEAAEGSIEVDKTLTVEDSAADAKAVGDAISNLTTDINNKVPVTRTINGKALSSNITLTAKDIGVEIDNTLQVSGKAADAKVTGEAISNLNNLIGDKSVADQITEAIVEVYVQDDEPEDAPDGSIWVDLSVDGAESPSEETIPNIHVVDAKTTDITTVDFSQYSVGDIVLVTIS